MTQSSLKYLRVLFTFCLSALLCGALWTGKVSAQTISARVEIAAVASKDIDSWQSKGEGLIRGEGNAIKWQQGFIKAEHQLNPNWKAKAVANIYQDGERHAGFTQAYLQYKPLSPNQIKFKAQFGLFYPAMSVENTDAGWLSPYTYTQSALNSWIGEELRTIGGQLAWFSNGRKRRSPWSWEVNIGVYKGNDPLGSLLTWRGFALHDRQSLHHDTVQFAPISSVSSPSTFDSPTYVPPFSEVDGKFGFYSGLHLSYLRKSIFKYYYYDNLADPNALNAKRIYAWRTKFHSLAYKHQFTPKWLGLVQVMDGSTLMGERSVYAKFTAWFAMLSYSHNAHRVSARFDHHSVREDDLRPEDPNSSAGQAMTLAWRYQWQNNIEVGGELHRHISDVANRALLDLPEKINQPQLRLVVSYTF